MLVLERYQVVVYALAILIGLGAGAALPVIGAPLAAALWPLLAMLLFATFSQMAPGRLVEAFGDRRFLAAAVIGNFVLVPIVVLVLLMWVPDEPAWRLGVLLVLLVPCTDWFISFTHLGGGDSPRAVAFAPLSLLLQMLLLPFYLWLFLGGEFVVSLPVGDLLAAFGGLIVLPLLLAMGLRYRLASTSGGQRWLTRLGFAQVPLLALVVFSIAAAQVALVIESAGMLPVLGGVFVTYLVLAALFARWLAGVFRLPPRSGRVLAFSMGTRNSFVVLPLALALPDALQAAVVVIVFQSLVELFGMMFYLRWVPGRLFPDSGPTSA